MKIPNNALQIACLVVLAALVGCAKPYLSTEVVTGPTAKVRLTTQGIGYGLFSAVHMNGHCKGMRSLGHIIGSENWNANGDIEASNLEMIGSSSIPDKQKIERKFRAGIPLTLEAQALTPVKASASGIATSSCRITFTFTPESNGEYEVVYNMGEKICRLNVLRLSLDPEGNPVRTPATGTKQEHERCW